MNDRSPAWLDTLRSDLTEITQTAAERHAAQKAFAETLCRQISR
jgi:hypothetical protein